MLYFLETCRLSVMSVTTVSWLCACQLTPAPADKLAWSTARLCMASHEKLCKVRDRRLSDQMQDVENGLLSAGA